ncbi:unnamed protein product [marine sediment metagenome]|uniref:Uncharacterized protein n=1 Tax=marine sediment metagenome TaxID=412755 RepID=X1BJJ4_9ZZZZ
MKLDLEPNVGVVDSFSQKPIFALNVVSLFAHIVEDADVN